MQLSYLSITRPFDERMGWWNVVFRRFAAIAGTYVALAIIGACAVLFVEAILAAETGQSRTEQLMIVIQLIMVVVTVVTATAIARTLSQLSAVRAKWAHPLRVKMEKFTSYWREAHSGAIEARDEIYADTSEPVTERRRSPAFDSLLLDVATEEHSFEERVSHIRRQQYVDTILSLREAANVMKRLLGNDFKWDRPVEIFVADGHESFGCVLFAEAMKMLGFIVTITWVIPGESVFKYSRQPLFGPPSEHVNPIAFSVGAHPEFNARGFIALHAFTDMKAVIQRLVQATENSKEATMVENLSGALWPYLQRATRHIQPPPPEDSGMRAIIVRPLPRE